MEIYGLKLMKVKNNFKFMTKFILHGGETGVPNEHNKAFYQEWVRDFNREKIPTILLIYFSDC